MDAIIYRSVDAPFAGAFDLAGRPLIIRQLQWLREIGIERIALEIAPHEEHADVVRALDADLALSASVTRLVTSTARDPLEIARRTELGRSGPLLLVPSHVIGGADLLRLLPSMHSSARLTLGRPNELERLPAAVVTILLPEQPNIVDVAGPDWGVALPTALDALELSAFVLSKGLEVDRTKGELGIQIHAAESREGIWLARGAKVERGARLTGPVYVGADAVVRSGARVGPGVVLLDRSVVERGAVVESAVVEADVIVGEGVHVSSAIVESKGVADLESGVRIDIDDPLVLGLRTRRSDRRDTRAIVAALQQRRATTKLRIQAQTHR